MSFSDPVFRFSDTPRIRCLVDQFEADSSYNRTETKHNSRGNAIGDIIRRLGASAVTVAEKEVVLKKRDNTYRFSTYNYEESDDSDYSEELNRVDGKFDDVKYVRVARFCGTVVGRLVYGLLALAVDCLPPVTFASLAVVCTLVVACAPRMLTDCVVYPFCRLVFGTLYPAYASYKAVRTKNVKEYVKWMMYWIVFALFTCAETVTDVFFSWFPFYYEVKIILVLWLLSPATKGSSILYRKFVHPALCRREQEIDEYISKAKDQGYHTVLNLGTKGVNYATNVIMQTAIKGGGGLVQQLRKSYSLSDLTVADDHTDGRSQQEEDEAGDVVMDSRLLRRTVSTRGRSPRSVGGSRVDMFFPEVDTNLSHGGRRDNLNLGHIRSSEDISTAYIPENMSSQDPLTRTASVGGTTRTRSKVTRSTFTSIKRPGAAEDGEVIIEEMDDEHIPSFLLQNSSNFSSENNGSVSLPYSKNMFEEYLKFMMRDNIQKELDEDNGLDVDYRKYLELKKMFEATLPNNSSAESGKIDEPKKGKETHSFDIITKENPSDISRILNDNKTESNDSMKNPIIRVNSIEVDTAEKSIEIEQKKDNSVDNESPPGPFLIKGYDEMKSISASSSNFSSDSESMNDSTFTTPNSSPLFRSKLNKGGKYNKRHAPPPPPVNNTSSSGQSDKNETNETASGENIDIVEAAHDRVSPIKATLVLKPGIVKEIGHTSGKKDVFISHPAAKRRHKPRNRSGRKSNIKHESTINKLINLPSRFAFWKTDDGKSSVSDDNSYSEDEVSTGSTSNYEDTSLSNFGSLVDIKVSSENLAEKTSINDVVDLGSKLNLNNDTQKVSESEDEPFQDAKEIATEHGKSVKIEDIILSKQESIIVDTEKNLNNLNPKESNMRVSTERLVESCADYTYIPLKTESLIMYTESRSTDV